MKYNEYMEKQKNPQLRHNSIGVSGILGSSGSTLSKNNTVSLPDLI